MTDQTEDPLRHLLGEALRFEQFATAQEKKGNADVAREFHGRAKLLRAQWRGLHSETAQDGAGRVGETFNCVGGAGGQKLLCMAVKRCAARQRAR